LFEWIITFVKEVSILQKGIYCVQIFVKTSTTYLTILARYLLLQHRSYSLFQCQLLRTGELQQLGFVIILAILRYKCLSSVSYSFALCFLPHLAGGGTSQAHWRNLLHRVQLKNSAGQLLWFKSCATFLGSLEA
jgi:hypothetical protein